MICCLRQPFTRIAFSHARHDRRYAFSPFSFPAVARKKVTAAFDGGRLTSDGGVMLLSMAERRLGIAERLARCFPDRRDPTRITHTLADMIRARIFAIACGYEDADDLEFLRTDPAFKLACGRLPDTGADLCSQPTLSRLENAPSPERRDPPDLCARRSMDGVLCERRRRRSRSTSTTPAMSRTAISSCRCSTPITTSAAFCRSMSTTPNAAVPSRSCCGPARRRRGVEVRAHLRRLVRRIRKRWPKTRITFRGDGHYARPEAMAWCEDNGVDYVFGLPGTKPLSRKVDEAADAVRTERAVGDKDVVRGYAETRHKAKSWNRERRAVARIEATQLGLDIRFVVTNLDPRLARVALRQPLLRARTGGKPDQAAQDAAGVRSHLVPLGARQSGAARAAHRRLLADARRARRHSQSRAIWRRPSSRRCGCG